MTCCDPHDGCVECPACHGDGSPDGVTECRMCASVGRVECCGVEQDDPECWRCAGSGCGACGGRGVVPRPREDDEWEG